MEFGSEYLAVKHLLDALFREIESTKRSFSKQIEDLSREIEELGEAAELLAGKRRELAGLEEEIKLGINNPTISEAKASLQLKILKFTPAGEMEQLFGKYFSAMSELELKGQLAVSLKSEIAELEKLTETKDQKEKDLKLAKQILCGQDLYKKRVLSDLTRTIQQTPVIADEPVT